jgi:exosortase A
MDQVTPSQRLEALDTVSSPKATAWKPYIVALILGAVALTAIFFPTAQEMIRVWIVSVAFEHCWLIPPVVAYLVWDRRQELKQLQPRIWLPGAFFAAVAGLVWLIGWAANVNFVQQFGYVFILQALVLTVLGPVVTRALLFPLFFCLFAVPFGEEFVPYLQKITAELSIWFLDISGLPYVRDGVFISVLTGEAGVTHNFEVAEECSGIRYMTAMAATATLFANIGFKSWKRRLILLAIAFVIPILANGFRAFGIIYIAHKTDMKHAVGVDHLIYGWVFFGLVMALVIFIGYLFMDRPVGEPVVDVQALQKMEQPGQRSHPVWYGALAAIGAAGVFVLYTQFSVATPVRKVELAIPEIPNWSVTDVPSSDWDPVYEDASDIEKRNYINSQGQIVTLFIAYYDSQHANREMVRYGHGPTGGELKWTWTSENAVPALKTSPKPHSFQMNASGLGLVKDVYQWYWVNGRIVSSESSAKLQGALARLFYGDKRAATIILATERQSEKSATDVLTQFTNDLGSVDAFAHAIVDPLEVK